MNRRKRLKQSLAVEVSFWGVGVGILGLGVEVGVEGCGCDAKMLIFSGQCG